MLTAWDPLTGVWILYVGVSWNLRSRYGSHLISLGRSKKQKVHELMAEHKVVPKMIVIADCSSAPDGTKEIWESILTVDKQLIHPSAAQHRAVDLAFMQAAKAADSGLPKGAIPGNAELSIFHYHWPRPASVDHVCTLCDESQGSASDLRTHTRTMHPNGGYVCPVDACGKAWPSPSVLAKHMACHDEEKSLKCSGCDYRTRWASGLKDHVFEQHQDGKYACRHADDGCSYEANNRNSLWIHQRFLCDARTEQEYEEVQTVFCNLGGCGHTSIHYGAMHNHRSAHEMCKQCGTILPLDGTKSNTVVHNRRNAHLSTCQPDHDYANLRDAFQPAVASAKALPCTLHPLCEVLKNNPSNLDVHRVKHVACVRGCGYYYPTHTTSARTFLHRWHVPRPDLCI